ncbi:MAG: hypothetical protein L3K26_15000 [Candidatus Hydrogenedentes bacterium]|nr:hypothetical protein [Candidatus Hydrogenedentota bacterium]
MKRHRARTPQSAYIFGGMEAIIFQGLIGGILGGLLVIKGYWQQIKAYFSGKTGEDSTSQDTGQEQSGD